MGLMGVGHPSSMQKRTLGTLVTLSGGTARPAYEAGLGCQAAKEKGVSCSLAPRRSFASVSQCSGFWSAHSRRRVHKTGSTSDKVRHLTLSSAPEKTTSPMSPTSVEGLILLPSEQSHPLEDDASARDHSRGIELAGVERLPNGGRALPATTSTCRLKPILTHALGPLTLTEGVLSALPLLILTPHRSRTSISCLLAPTSK